MRNAAGELEGLVRTCNDWPALSYIFYPTPPRQEPPPLAAEGAAGRDLDLRWWFFGGLLVVTKYIWYTVFRRPTTEAGMPISGREMLKRYLQAGWQILGRRGSHVKVGKGSLREVIPMHRELKKGLEQKLLKYLGSGGKE